MEFWCNMQATVNKEDNLKKSLEWRCYIAPREQLTGLGTSRCYLLSRMFTWRGVQACYFTSVVSNSTIQCTVAHQAPLSMGFSRQEYWSGLPCPPPGHLPDPGIEPGPLMSPALAGGFFTTGATWEEENPFAISFPVKLYSPNHGLVHSSCSITIC